MRTLKWAWVAVFLVFLSSAQAGGWLSIPFDEMMRDSGNVTSPVQPHFGSYKIQNRGNIQISITLLRNDGSACGGDIKIPSGQIVTFYICKDGKNSSNTAQIRMHDGHEYRNFSVAEGKIYEIYWSSDKWDFRDITQERLQ
jgi:hypothetical protein